jgi:hypothetical protein
MEWDGAASWDSLEYGWGGLGLDEDVFGLGPPHCVDVIGFGTHEE